MSDTFSIDARDAAWEQNIWIANRCNSADPATLCSASAAASAAAAQGARTASTAPQVVSARPEVNQSRWPCLQVPVWDVDPVDGGTWVWITVVAPRRPERVPTAAPDNESGRPRVRALGRPSSRRCRVWLRWHNGLHSVQCYWKTRDSNLTEG